VLENGLIACNGPECQNARLQVGHKVTITTDWKGLIWWQMPMSVIIKPISQLLHTVLAMQRTGRPHTA
jgi:hypothetical protein